MPKLLVGVVTDADVNVGTDAKLNVVAEPPVDVNVVDGDIITFFEPFSYKPISGKVGSNIISLSSSCKVL